MKNKKIVINSLALALGIGALSPAASSIVAGGGSDLSPLISQAYAAEENVDDTVDESTPIEDDKIEEPEELEGLEVAPEVEKQAVGSEENKSITYKNYETEVKYSDELAYGDYRIDQEGVLGQYEDNKEIVAPVNQVMTVGTNKDLVEKIKYNEKYSIEDPGTFDYVGHALRNIEPTNEGLKRNIYTIYNSLNGIDKDGNVIAINSDIYISDGADLSKEIDEQIKLGTTTLDESLFLYPIDDKESTSLEENMGIYEQFSNYIDNIRKLNEENNEIKTFSSASDIAQYLIINQIYQDEEDVGYIESKFYVDNSYKTPLVINYSDDKHIIFLNKETFDKVYEELYKNWYTKIKNPYQNYFILYLNNDFVEIPRSFSSKSIEHYEDKSDYVYVGIDSHLIDPSEIINHKPNGPERDLYITNLEMLNPERTYEIYAGIDGSSNEYLDNLDYETAQKEFNSTLVSTGDFTENYYYYNIQNTPYVSDPNLKFNEIVDENETNKNVVAPIYNQFQIAYDELLQAFHIEHNDLSEEEIEQIEQFLQDGPKPYYELLNSDKLTENRFKFLKNNIDDLIKENADDYPLEDIEDIMKHDFISEASSREALKFLNNDTWSNRIPYKRIGNVDTKVEEKDFKVIEKEDPELAKGETKVLTEGVKGKKVTKITYKVNRINGELTDPVEEVIEDIKPVDKVVLVGTKEVTPATPIEDIAKTTKTTNEVIKAKVVYEADEDLAFEEQVVDKAPIDGEKEITTVSQSGKEDVVTEDIIKEPEDGKTRVGNKKVETKTNEDGSITTTTTIYDVDPDTGELVNPRSTSKTTMPATPIEDIAKTTKTTNEVIKGKVVYEADEELTFEEQVVDKVPVDGEKEITTVSQSGKEDVVTEDIIKEPEDGKTRVGNKKVEVKNNEDGSITTTTTIYDVDPDTGELENPRSTSTTVKKPQNELYEPEGADQTTDVNKPLNPEDFITNIKDLPEDTKFEFEEQPDFDKPGESKVKIVATYPDGTKDTVESKLTVNDVEKPSTSNKTNVIPNTVKPATTAAPTRTNVKAQTGGGVSVIGGLIAGLTAAAGSIFKRRKK